MTPNKLLEKLKLDSSSKKQETLEIIYQICEEQLERGVNDFSIATIAKLGNKRGVPRAQSLRNKTGEKYQALIQCFAEEATKKSIPKKIPKNESSWIDEIDNPKHKLLVRMLASELKSTKKQLDEVIPPNLRVDVYDHKTAPLESNFKLTRLERSAFEYILSQSFRNKWQLTENEYGELVDSSSTPVFKVSTIDAIKKALEYL